jgi:hypothetical protein
MATPRRELSPADTKEQTPLDGAGAFEEFTLDCEGDDELKSAISKRRRDGWKVHNAVKRCSRSGV